MIEIIDLLKPKNGGSFKLIEDIDIAVNGYSSLADCVAHMATTAMIDAINAVIAGKANASELATAEANLQNQIDQIVISASAESVVAPEVAAARVDSEGNSYTTLKDHLDATEIGFNSKLENIGSATTSGFNLLNTKTIKRNRILLSDGTENDLTGAYISDYIAVQPQSGYKVDRAIGSEQYPTLVYYDENKEVLGASDGSSKTFTTPSGCYYVRENGSLSYLSQSMVSPSYVSERFDYKTVLNGVNSIRCQLWAVTDIFYYDSALHASSAIYLSMPDSMTMLSYGNSVNVSGSGTYLFWNKETNTFTASNNNLASENVYFVAFLKYKTFEPEFKFVSLTCAYPAFKFDFIANKLYIKFNYDGFIMYNGQTITIPQNYTQELSVGTHSIIVYNIATNQFESVSYNTVQYDKSKYIPICVRNYADVVGNCDYETVISAKSYKKCVCYGDSLTWYDGHEFTWGSHQGEMCVGFESYLRAYLRMAVTNVGVSGETTPQICARLAGDTAPETADYITIMGGDNDDRLSVEAGTVLPVGSTFDRTTVAGALQYAIEAVLDKNPDARIIIMTEPMGWTYRDGDMERVDDIYPETYRKVAKQYGLPIVDNWYESGINELNREEYMIDPTVAAGNTDYIYHPSNKAWERIARNLCEVLKKY